MGWLLVIAGVGSAITLLSALGWSLLPRTGLRRLEDLEQLDQRPAMLAAAAEDLDSRASSPRLPGAGSFDVEAELLRLEQTLTALGSPEVKVRLRGLPTQSSSTRQVSVSVQHVDFPLFLQTLGPARSRPRRWRLAAIAALAPRLVRPMQRFMVRRGACLSKGEISFAAQVGTRRQLRRLGKDLRGTIKLLRRLTELDRRLPAWLLSRFTEGSGYLEAFWTLLMALKCYPTSSKTREILEHAIASTFDPVRLVAALKLGDDVLLEVVPDLDLRRVEVGHWIQALERLRDAASREVFLEQLRRSLSAPRAELLMFVVREYVNLGMEGELVHVTACVEELRGASLTRFANSLCDLDEPLVEALLISVIGRFRVLAATGFGGKVAGRHDELHRAWSAVLKKLEESGTPRCVPELREQLRDRDNPDMHHTDATAAIEAIKQRWGGGLSVLDSGVEGGLSLVGPTGTLAIDRDDTTEPSDD